MERFACRTEILCGEGALQALTQWEGKRLAVITDPLLSRQGVARKITEVTRCREVLLMDDICQEPTIRQAVEGARKLQEFRGDRVIAVGACHVLDYAKAVRCFAKAGGTLTAIPAGIGIWEAFTDSAILTHEGRRHILQDESMRPDRVILDAGMPEYTARGTLCEEGFSLLAAAVESYCGRRGGILTGLQAREAFSMAWAALPAAIGGDRQARERVMAASALAGMAQAYSGEGLCGALCGSLECAFHLPKGKLAAMVLPAVMGWNVHGVSRGYGELARAAGMGGSSNAAGSANLRSGLLRLRRELGLPGSLVRAGIDPKRVWNQAGRIVQMTLEDPRCRNNPITVDDFMVRRILEEITGRF